MTEFRVVDADGHVQEPEDLWPNYLEPQYHSMAPRTVWDDQGRRRRFLGGHYQPYIPAPPERGPGLKGGFDPKARLADMDSELMDVSVIYPSAGLHFGSIEQIDVYTALSRAYNDWLYDYCKADPERLVGIATVPQSDINATMEESTRAATELGFKGIFVRPNPIAGRTVDNPAFDPLWSHLEELDIPLCLHEGTTQDVPQAGFDRYENFLFRHVISHPHEMQMACLSIICGGVLERHPKLRVAFLESGVGWIAHWLERLDHHMDYWGHASARLSIKPSEYFLRQCYISADPDEAILPGIISVIGSNNILFASDYPHPDGIFPGVVTELTDRKDIAEDSKRRILWDNPAKLYGLT